MVENNIDYTDEYNCPLLSKIIEEGLCYDIQMVRCNCIKETVLKFKLDRDNANELCDSCEFNQLRGD